MKGVEGASLLPLFILTWKLLIGGVTVRKRSGWFDRMSRAIESSGLFVWFMRRRFRGLKVHRWIEDWIGGHYPDKDVHILDCDVHTGRATVCMEMCGDHVMVGVPGYAERA